MENKELDIFMAEKVNKWHKDIDRHTGKWIDENGKDTGYYYKYPRHLISIMIWWNPTENHEQAFICLEKLRNTRESDGYCHNYVRIRDKADEKNQWEVAIIKRWKKGKVFMSEGETLPLAICQAIYKALTGE